jgi:hypothetical protein
MTTYKISDARVQKLSILYFKNEFAKQFFHGSLNNFGHKGLAVIILCNQIQHIQKTVQPFF